MKKCWNIFVTMFLSTLVMYTFIVKENDFIKSGVIIFVILIIINLYFYKKLVTFFRKSYLEIINFALYVTSIILLIFSYKDFNKFIIKFKDILNDISLKNTYYYIIIVSMFILTILIIVNLFKDFNKIKINKNQLDKIKLLSFREKEKKRLKEIIEDKKITSILIEAEMGNGKTTFINSLIEDFENDMGCEIIYFKLPLIKSYEELEKNLLLELQKILVKYDLNNKFINNLLNDVSTLKLGCIEINLGRKKSIWNTLQELQRTLMKIDKKILIILDDIEREENLEKIYKSILFLGELSEYFKNTNITILLLTQYNHLELAFNKALESKKINRNSVYLDKYYKYRFRLNEPTISDLNDDDLRLIIEEVFNSAASYISISSEKEKIEFFNSIIQNIRLFFNFNDLVLEEKVIENQYEFFRIDLKAMRLLGEFNNELKNTKFKINIRNFEKIIKEKIYIYNFYKMGSISYQIFSFFILKKNYKSYLEKDIQDILFNFNEEDKSLFQTSKIIDALFEENLKIYMNLNLKNYSNNPYNNFKKEINKIETLYNNGEIIVEEVGIITDKIINILEGKEKLSQKISIIGYEDYIYNLVKGNIKKIDIALINGFINTREELVKIINSISEKLIFSRKAILKMRNLLKKNSINEKADSELDINNNFYISDLDFLEEEHEKFLRKISEIKELKNDISEIKQVLQEDISEILNENN